MVKVNNKDTRMTPLAGTATAIYKKGHKFISRIFLGEQS